MVLDNCGDFCASWSNNYLAWAHPGLGPSVLFMILQGFFFFLVIMFLESGAPDAIWQKVTVFQRLFLSLDGYKRAVYLLHRWPFYNKNIATNSI